MQVNRSNIIKVYNTNMGGVDFSDMFLFLYRLEIRSRLWYIRIFYYLLDLSLANGWLLYRRHLTQNQKKSYITLVDFRAEVTDSPIKEGKLADMKCRKRGRETFDLLWIMLSY